MERQKSINESLDQLEVNVSKVGQDLGITSEGILDEMDSIRTRLDDLKTQGRPATAEEAQFEFIAKTLKDHSKAFIKEIGGLKTLTNLRSMRQPDRKAWWWFLDEIQSDQRKRTLKKQLIWFAGIAVALVILYAVYQLFLAPSPATEAALTFESNIENSLISGDLNNALAQANQGLTTLPDNVTLLILKGIAQTKLGQTDDGTQAFSQAEKLIGNRESYLLQRTLLYIRSGDAKSALNDAQTIVVANPQSAEGYFYEALAYQSLNDSMNAYNAFDKAQTLANDQGKTVLVATIRLDMALLMQNMGAQIQSPTP